MSLLKFELYSAPDGPDGSAATVRLLSAEFPIATHCAKCVSAGQQGHIVDCQLTPLRMAYEETKKAAGAIGNEGQAA